MIILDLEWNRGYDNKKLSEILQIGAVRQERPGGWITDTFNVFIRPRVHKRFDLGAKVLPELQAARDSEIDFPTAMAAFLQWAGPETVFAAWGIDDLEILRQNCEYWDVPCIQTDKAYDFQAAFSLLVGAEQQIALYRAVEYCKIPTPFTFHNALNDSVYTAMIGERLTPDLLVMQAVPRKIRRLAQIQFPRQPKRRVGPFQAPKVAMDHRTCRMLACPICGTTAWVLEWHFSDPRRCYGTFQCPEHGKFLCRLTLSLFENGRWRGRLAIPEITPNVLLDYDAAVKGTSYICKGKSRKRRKRRRARKRAKKGSEPCQLPETVQAQKSEENHFDA